MTRWVFPIINKVMAIKRCPYCKAIIDEGAEYCSNCGTQLLFPEDESIDEEIPGEKIEEEKIKEEKPEPEKKRKLRKKKSTPKKKAKEEKEEKTHPQDKPEEDVPEETLDKEDTEKELGEMIFSEDKTEETPAKKREIDFKTADLEGITDSDEKEKEDIEKFLDTIRKDREEIKEETQETGDELPPWAEKLKESPPSEVHDTEEEIPTEEPLEPGEVIPPEVKDAEESEEEIQIEEPIEQEEDITDEEEKDEDKEIAPTDTGMGLPEGADQESLLFDGMIEKKEKKVRERPPSRFFSWLKSRVFDLLFIAALWLVTLWLASRVVEVSLFQLISASILSVAAFYIVLLVIYFFLFFVFLGETLGDHLFTQEE